MFWKQWLQLWQNQVVLAPRCHGKQVFPLCHFDGAAPWNLCTSFVVQSALNSKIVPLCKVGTRFFFFGGCYVELSTNLFFLNRPLKEASQCWWMYTHPKKELDHGFTHIVEFVAQQWCYKWTPIFLFFSHMSHYDSPYLLSHTSHYDSLPWVTMTPMYAFLWLTLTHYELYYVTYCPSDSIVLVTVIVPVTLLFSFTISTSSLWPYSLRLDFCILRHRQAIRVLSPLSSPCPLFSRLFALRPLIA